MSNKHNLVICLEGADGCGKTSQALLLTECIKYNNKHALYSREPGGSPIGEILRDLFLNHFSSLSIEDQILLMNLSRKEHIKCTINPALENNYIVILDRYFLSTLVYQGRGEPNLINKINMLHKEFIHDFYPTLTFLLNTDSEIAIQRIKNRTKNNILDKIIINEHKKIKNLYLEQVKKNEYKAPCIIIDSNSSILEIHQNIIHHINKNIKINLNPLNKEQILTIIPNYFKYSCV